jgi:hypothetical protein
MQRVTCVVRNAPRHLQMKKTNAYCNDAHTVFLTLVRSFAFDVDCLSQHGECNRLPALAGLII